MPTLGEVIKAWRLYKDLTLEEVAQRSSVSSINRSRLSRLERGDPTTPTHRFLEGVAHGLGIPLLYLLIKVSPADLEKDPLCYFDLEGLLLALKSYTISTDISEVLLSKQHERHRVLRAIRDEINKILRED